MGHRIAVFDTETTGLPKNGLPLQHQPYIVEVGVVICDQDYNILSEHEWLVNPVASTGEQVESEPKAFEAHKLSLEELSKAPPFAGVYPELCDVMLGVKGLVAHNLNFDLSLLKYALMRINKQTAFPYPPDQICTVQSTMHFKGHRLSMQKLWQYLFGEENLTKHRALDDVKHLVEICKELQKRGVI